MKNQIVASIAALPFALGAVFAGTGAANAQVIQLDDMDANGGTISYDGTGGALIGKNIGIDLITGIGTKFNNEENPLTCIDCFLNFETGLNMGEEPYAFAAGGFITVTGTVKDLNDDNDILIADGTFLSGKFTEKTFGSAVDLGLMGIATFSSIGVDTKDAAIGEYFGIDTTEYHFGQTSIAIGEVNVEANGGFTGTVTNADLDNIPVDVDVPEPTVLFGLGVVAAGIVSRRRKNS
ncbi:MAG: PEP-CTERM sorting domain-containing protein [Cyanobacteriota bacterium]|nr:PEP-CTERM sorting domain-containing protein [Cyanobacteriota bacterium]